MNGDIYMKKVLIIGSGPAGISASLYLARSSIADVTVISNGKGALAKAEMIENYFGFAEPISGKQLLENGKKGAERLGVKFIEAELTSLGFTDDMRYEAEYVGGRDSFDAVLIATGAARKAPSINGIKDFEGKGVSYCAVCDAFFCRGKDVAVIGSVDYALHEASTLLQTASSVTLLTNGQETNIELPEKIKLIKTGIKALHGSDRLSSVEFDDGSSISVSGVFVAVGTAGSTDIARKLGAAVDDGKIIVDESFAANVPGVFAAGDCIGGLMQVSKAVSDGAAAGINMIRYLKQI